MLSQVSQVHKVSQVSQALYYYAFPSTQLENKVTYDNFKPAAKYAMIFLKIVNFYSKFIKTMP